MAQLRRKHDGAFKARVDREGKIELVKSDVKRVGVKLNFLIVLKAYRGHGCLFQALCFFVKPAFLWGKKIKGGIGYEKG